MESINSYKIVLLGQKYAIHWKGNGNLLQHSCLGDHGKRSLMGNSPWDQVTFSICSLATSHHTSDLPYLHKFTSERLWVKSPPPYLTVSPKQTDGAGGQPGEDVHPAIWHQVSPSTPLIAESTEHQD